MYFFRLLTLNKNLCIQLSLSIKCVHSLYLIWNTIMKINDGWVSRDKFCVTSFILQRSECHAVICRLSLDREVQSRDFWVSFAVCNNFLRTISKRVTLFLITLHNAVGSHCFLGIHSQRNTFEVMSQCVGHFQLSSTTSSGRCLEILQKPLPSSSFSASPLYEPSQ